MSQLVLVVAPHPDDESIDLKHFIHKLHTGASLQHAPYVIYGFGNAPKRPKR